MYNGNTYLLNGNEFLHFEEIVPTVYVAIYAICVKTFIGSAVNGKNVRILPFHYNYGNLSDSSPPYKVPSKIRLDDCKVLDEIKWTKLNFSRGLLIYNEDKEKNPPTMTQFEDKDNSWTVQIIISSSIPENVTAYPPVIEKLTTDDCIFWEEDDFLGKECRFKNDKVCPNWRLRGEIGKTCFYKITVEDEKLSAKVFCRIHKLSDECKCINKHLYKDYLSKKDKLEDTNTNWYPPCDPTEGRLTLTGFGSIS